MTNRNNKGGLRALPTASPPESIPFLDLGDGWALAADRIQWMVVRARKSKDRIKWQPASFVASNKAVLARVLDEKGIAVPPDASGAVNRFFVALAHEFPSWRESAEMARRGAA